MARSPKGSLQYINKLNKIRILNLIRENRRLSRAAAAKLSGISAPTVTRVVESLINEEKLICEMGAGRSSGGRRPTMLEFAGHDNFVIGIDLGTTHIHGLLANLNAEPIAEIELPSDFHEGPDSLVNRTAMVINDLLAHPKVRGKKVFGAALAVAGLIDLKQNIIEFSPNLHWRNVDILAGLKEKCDLPVIFDNVTRVMALAELWYGLGHEVKNFIMVNIGYGIGAGIILDGIPLYGPRGMAGEFGHITLQKDSAAKCECGNYGCLEAISSGRAIAIHAQMALQSGAQSRIRDLCAGDLSKISAEMVAIAAHGGDELAKTIYHEAAEYIGIGIAGLVNLFSPEAVIIGGGVSQAGALLFDTLEETVRRRSISNLSAGLKICPATFGVKTAVMGAIALILNEVLQLNFELIPHRLAGSGQRL